MHLYATTNLHNGSDSEKVLAVVAAEGINPNLQPDNTNLKSSSSNAFSPLPTVLELPALMRELSKEDYSFQLQLQKSDFENRKSFDSANNYLLMVSPGEIVDAVASVQKKEFAIAGKQVVFVVEKNVNLVVEEERAPLVGASSTFLNTLNSRESIDYLQTKGDGKARFKLYSNEEGVFSTGAFFLHNTKAYSEHFERAKFLVLNKNRFSYNFLSPFFLMFVFFGITSLILVVGFILLLLRKVRGFGKYCYRVLNPMYEKSKVFLYEMSFMFPALHLFYSKRTRWVGVQLFFFYFLCISWLVFFLINEVLALTLVAVLFFLWMAVNNKKVEDGTKPLSKNFSFSQKWASKKESIMLYIKNLFLFIISTLLFSFLFFHYNFIPLEMYDSLLSSSIRFLLATVFVFCPSPLIAGTFFVVFAQQYLKAFPSDGGVIGGIVEVLQLASSNNADALRFALLLFILSCFTTAAYAVVGNLFYKKNSKVE